MIFAHFATNQSIEQLIFVRLAIITVVLLVALPSGSMSIARIPTFIKEWFVHHLFRRFRGFLLFIFRVTLYLEN